MIGLLLGRDAVAAVRVAVRDGAQVIEGRSAVLRPGSDVLRTALAAIDEVAGRDRELAVAIDVEDAVERRFLAPPAVDGRARRRMAEAAALPLVDLVGPTPEIVLERTGEVDEYDVGYIRARTAALVRAIARARRLKLARARWLPATLALAVPDVQGYARVTGTAVDLVLLGARSLRRLAFDAGDDAGWALHVQLAEARNVQQTYEPVDVRRLVLETADDPATLAALVADRASVDVIGFGTDGPSPDAGVDAHAAAYAVAAEPWFVERNAQHGAAARRLLDFAAARSRHVEAHTSEPGVPATRLAAVLATSVLVVVAAVEGGRGWMTQRAVTALRVEAAAATATAERVKRMSRDTQSLATLAAARERYAASGDRLAWELEALATLLPRDTWLESVAIDPATGRMNVHGYAASPAAWARLVSALAPRAPEGGFAKQLKAGDVVEWRTSISSAAATQIGAR